jgi:lysophospholipase L1-like esterase
MAMIKTVPVAKKTWNETKERILNEFRFRPDFGIRSNTNGSTTACSGKFNLKCTSVLLVSSLVIYALIGYYNNSNNFNFQIVQKGLTKTTKTANASQQSLSSVHDRPIRVFCYGDSLTAGMTRPSNDLYPYATYLQQTSLPKEGSNASSFDFEVDHVGLPGWTSNELLDILCNEDECPQNQTKDNTVLFSRMDDEQREAIRTKILQQQSVSTSSSSYWDIFIYLAGTNDIPRQTRSVDDIVTSIMNVHIWAHTKANIPYTIAISIPPSLYQNRVKLAEDRVNEINTKLRQSIQEYNTNTTNNKSSQYDQKAIILFVEFPFKYENDSNLWASDGLHFTQLGYQTLGEYLASTIDAQLLQ